MRTIFKFPLGSLLQGLPLTIPTVGKVTHVGKDPNGAPCIWAEHEEGAPLTTEVWIFGTGHSIPPGWSHAGTFIDGPFVWHVYTKETT